MTKKISLAAPQQAVSTVQTQTVPPAVAAAPSAPVAPKVPKIPLPHAGLQYNHCKNPRCDMFGVPPDAAPKGSYTVSSGGRGYPLLRCNACGEAPPLKSNLGITEEMDRLSAYLEAEPPMCCPNHKPDPTTGEICPNHLQGIPVDTPKAYRSYGRNAHGSSRTQCTACKKVFVTGGKPTRRQRETHHNRDIFTMLVNKVALSRIVKMLDISWDVLYHRIDFIHSQCMAFVAKRERKLRDMPIRRLYLSVDAQDYLVNWTKREDKRNVVLKAVSAVDNRTGYVFAHHLNFDEKADAEVIEARAAAVGDNLLPAPRRRYARYWLAKDYMDSVNATASRRKGFAETLLDQVSRDYASAALRDDIEAFDGKVATEKLPDHGMQIHSEYTMIAMFHHLKGMVGNCAGWRFFMDQESGIRAACLSAFADRIKTRTCEAFYVKIEKELTVEEKRKRLEEAKKRFNEVAQAHEKAIPKPDEDAIRLIMIKEEIAAQRRIGAFGDQWVSMPLPTMSEPGKAVCWLTAHDDFRDDDGEIDHDHIARLHAKASLHAVDSYFMKTRRSIAMCERPFTSSGNSGRKWNAYQAYDPAVLKKLIEIFRVHHNYIDLPAYKKGVRKADRTTPAMRLGLADAPLDFRDILYFEG